MNDEKTQYPTFTHIRSIFVEYTKEDGEVKPGQLMSELFKLKWDEYLKRVTPKGTNGQFSITFKDNESKTKIEKLWQTKVDEGKLSFRILTQDPIRKHKLTLDNLPEEVPTKTIQCYLKKYLIDPEVTIKTISDEEWGTIEIGEAEVSHKGLRRPLTRKVWVGPGVKANVKHTSQIPWDVYKHFCSLCKGEGHKAWECEKQKCCYKCKMTTHASLDCPYCNTCEKYGHETSKCCLASNNKKDKDTEAVVEESMDTTQSTGTEGKSTTELLKEIPPKREDKEHSQTPKKKKRKRKKPARSGQVMNDSPSSRPIQVNSDNIALSDSCSEDEFVNESDDRTWTDVTRKRRHKNASGSSISSPTASKKVRESPTA